MYHVRRQAALNKVKDLEVRLIGEEGWLTRDNAGQFLPSGDLSLPPPLVHCWNTKGRIVSKTWYDIAHHVKVARGKSIASRLGHFTHHVTVPRIDIVTRHVRTSIHLPPETVIEMEKGDITH